MFPEQNRLVAPTRTRRMRSARVTQAPSGAGPQELTERERDVLGLAGQGLSIKGIAQALGISSGTVTWHLKNCYQKYGVSSREQALRHARLQAQIRPVGTAVCSCGRVHTLWGPAAMDSLGPESGLTTWKEEARK